MDVSAVYHRTVEFFVERVVGVKQDQWDDPTPCTDWSVRDLVNHVTSENLWTVPLMEGATIEDVGDRFDGDLLGTDPIGSAQAAAAAAVATVAEQLHRGGTVQLSFGETAKTEYALQLAADHLIHGWDLAAATGGDTRMDPQLVEAVADWFDDQEDAMEYAQGLADTKEGSRVRIYDENGDERRMGQDGAARGDL